MLLVIISKRLGNRLFQTEVCIFISSSVSGSIRFGWTEIERKAEGFMIL